MTAPAPSAPGGSGPEPTTALSWRELAVTDPLTGLPNRRRLDEVVSAAWGGWRRDRRPVSMLMIDIDHFKALNDAAGHPAGDACLRAVATALATTCDVPEGLVCRWGGEEFLALLPGTDAAAAAGVAHLALASIRNLALPHATAPASRVTVSIGVATAPPTAEMAPDDLVAQADRALYAAKRAGRDRVAIAAD
jgi:diguanylate cyclase (GGDEF)-like protein